MKTSITANLINIFTVIFKLLIAFINLPANQQWNIASDFVLIRFSVWSFV